MSKYGPGIKIKIKTGVTCSCGSFLYVHVMVTQSAMVRKCRPYRWSSQPAVLVFGAVHVPVKRVELSVTQVIRVHKVKLSPGVMVTLIVPFPGEVQPLRVAKLIPCEIKKSNINTSILSYIIYPGLYISKTRQEKIVNFK